MIQDAGAMEPDLDGVTIGRWVAALLLEQSDKAQPQRRYPRLDGLQVLDNCRLDEWRDATVPVYFALDVFTAGDSDQPDVGSTDFALAPPVAARAFDLSMAREAEING
jgi:hypothetical protein